LKHSALYILLTMLLACCIFLSACAPPEPSSSLSEENTIPPRKRTVMLSLFNDNNPWPIALAKDLRSTAQERGYDFILTNAKGDPQL